MRRIFSRAIKGVDNRKSKSELNFKRVNKSSESNLSKDEVLGLKSLKKRVSEGNVVICDTDKTKRFAALTPDQYIASGLVHTKGDIEIKPSDVKSVQNV